MGRWTTEDADVTVGKYLDILHLYYYDMKYKLKLNMLLPGDIILAGYNDDLSREIQARTGSRFSHAMLYWRDSIIHAGDIVITENPSWMLFDADESVCVLRLKDAPGNELRIHEIIKHARSFVGTLYDTDALNALNNGEKHSIILIGRCVLNLLPNVMIMLV